MFRVSLINHLWRPFSWLRVEGVSYDRLMILEKKTSWVVFKGLKEARAKQALKT